MTVTAPCVHLTNGLYTNIWPCGRVSLSIYYCRGMQMQTRRWVSSCKASLRKTTPRFERGFTCFRSTGSCSYFGIHSSSPCLQPSSPTSRTRCAKDCVYLCGRCKLLLLFSAAHNSPWPSCLFLTCPLLSKSRKHAPTRMHPRTQKKYAHRSAR